MSQPFESNTPFTPRKEPQFTIAPARFPEDLHVVSILFTAYTGSLPIDLAYQDFTVELNSLPGKYAPPTGELLLTRTFTGEPIGCVAVRPLPGLPDCCEMKRLYTLPSGRGLGIGRALVKAVLEVATRLGYTEMKLDTLPSMTAAIKLYSEEGFGKTEAYYATPIAETVFLARRLC
ncbi:3'(2'),5'-bisphosphate nucleotidase [Coniosporium tulheliwenetii]|uniref:3'(2'),5'-bisphosphate nucleotidase n=1 Tax=Coniosporium tulheliwenetii TaxID=3383036 RepID=A0ACC2ZNH8_9PEZI|nr:3'(2'),5'-bisphosphate nucleotidase [Cladosporium sp. JES 115]